MTLLDLVVLSAVVYRATRFVELDTMFEDTRDRLLLWLGLQQRESKGRIHTVYRKLLDGATCAFCVSVWFAALATIAWAWVSPYELAWASIFHWLAVATGAMVFYRYIDPPE